MDSLVQLFEVVVLASTGLSVAALVGFIAWDSIIDASRLRQPAARKQVRADGIRLADGMVQPLAAGMQSASAKAA
jgi:hypothetical protein